MRPLEPDQTAKRAWSEADLQQLRELVAAQASVREIAERLGRTEYAVRSKARLERISLRQNAPLDGPRNPR
jgi:hypothetical protein